VCVVCVCVCVCVCLQVGQLVRYLVFTQGRKLPVKKKGTGLEYGRGGIGVWLVACIGTLSSRT